MFVQFEQVPAHPAVQRFCQALGTVKDNAGRHARQRPGQAKEQAGAFMGIWLEALIRVGALSKIEASFIAKDGRRVPILFSRTAVKGGDGEITDIICIAKDMTGYIRTEDADAASKGAERTSQQR